MKQRCAGLETASWCATRGRVLVAALACLAFSAAGLRAQDAAEPKPAGQETPPAAQPAPAEQPVLVPVPAPTPAPEPGHEGHNHPPAIDGTPVPNPTVTPDPNGPVAQPVEPKHDFGEFWSGEDLEHTFVIKNVGKALLKVPTVKPGCGCTLAGAWDKEIPPGGEGKIPVKVATKNFNGKFSKTIAVTTDDPANANLRLEIVGTAKQFVSVEPANAMFSQIKSDDVLTKTLKITNNSEEPLQLTLAEAKSGPFSAELKEIEPGKRFELEVKGNPPYQQQLNRGTFSLTTNVAKQQKIDVQCSAYLPPRIEIKPQNITIPTAINKESTRTLRFSNNGSTDVRVTEVVSEDPKVEAEVIERTAGKAYDIQVKLPQGYLPPENGTKLVLKTTDTEFASVDVPLLQPAKPKPQPRPGEKLLGNAAPKVEFETTEGKKIALGEPSDEIYVLEFYASWCGFCKRSMPEVEKVYQQYKDKGVRIIGISQDEVEGRRARKPEDVIKQFKDAKYNFELALDPEKKVGGPFFANSYPTMYLVGKSGKVEQAHFGAKQNLAEELAKELDLLLAGKPIPRETPSAAAPAPTPAAVAGTANLPLKPEIIRPGTDGAAGKVDDPSAKPD